MKKKLIFLQSLLITAVLIIFLSLGIVFSKNALISEAEDHTVALTHAYLASFDGEVTSLRKPDEGIRETILNQEGIVLWDSEEDASKMEPHANREEVVAALNGTPKVVQRSSSTFGTDYIYYAETKTIENEVYVVRVALLTSSLTRFITSYIPWLVVAGVGAIGIGFGFTTLIVSSSLKPLKDVEENLESLKEGKPIEKKEYRTHDELTGILEDINELSSDLERLFKANEKEKEKLSLVLSNVPNPILAISPKGKILFINDEARETLSLYGDTFPSSLTLENGKIYYVPASKKSFLITKTENGDLILYVLNDITSQIEAEKRRKEFVDAASHELKTPLTSIKGFNELIALESKDPKIQSFSDKIGEASKRMLSVVGDMLSISSLEESQTVDAPLLDLTPIAKQVFDELAPLAKQKEVSCLLSGNGKSPIDEKDAYLILKNLVENAILYNVTGGKVTVTLNDCSFSVSDTGIGIPKKDQERVFERFYRVDKSRSRANGGTGLGLSIVKHAAAKYNGKVTLTSTPGFGSSFEVSFLKK